MLAKFIKEEGVDEVGIGSVVFMLLFYADDVELFAICKEMCKAYERSGRVLHAY